MDKTPGQIAYEAAAAVTGCDQPWAEANQAKWDAAARAAVKHKIGYLGDSGYWVGMVIAGAQVFIFKDPIILGLCAAVAGYCFAHVVLAKRMLALHAGANR